MSCPLPRGASSSLPGGFFPRQLPAAPLRQRQTGRMRRRDCRAAVLSGKNPYWQQAPGAFGKGRKGVRQSGQYASLPESQCVRCAPLPWLPDVVRCPPPILPAATVLPPWRQPELLKAPCAVLRCPWPVSSAPGFRFSAGLPAPADRPARPVCGS